MTDCLFSHHNDAAPLGSVRLAPALRIDGPRRQRRRGPRSQIALLRRSVPKHRRTLPVSCLGESRHIETESISSKKPHNFKNINFASESVASVASACNLVHDVSIYSVNSQCLFAHMHFAELCFQLEVHSPHVVCVQETWLDDSIKQATIPGYVNCSRRDRHKGANRGGIAVFRREDFNGIVHITNSEKEERSWHFLKLGVETYLLANWYRLGASEFDGFSSLYSELAEYFPQNALRFPRHVAART